MTEKIDRLAKLLEAKDIERKSAEITRARNILAGKWQLAEQEFENLLQNPAADEAAIESARQGLLALYEQFIDACLAFRTQNNYAILRLEQIMKEIRES